ncbi:MAG: sigma-54-dependent Fis family transcriptional regulator [Ectothiorhodospiraceae bacterium]|nr:sigma-54-dependent Fis family transcriptional regulator [Ectothiorhodospiraceae bacterium]MCH8504979.1 sigma-54 dependent transcriptional regulator [Ectothiorhodospiraceae bacterium]
MTASILVVDDEPDIRTLVQDILEDEDYHVQVAEDAAAARNALRQRRPDLILLDIWMPDTDGISLLKEWSQGAGLPCPVVMMSGHGNVETAVEATRLGAYDFIEKPLSLAKLLLVVERALEAERLARENRGLRERVDSVVEPVGSSVVFEALLEQARRVAGHDTWVLITGESGSGKRTFAHYMHRHSPRRTGPFVEVAAGSIAGSGAAPELFGSEEGGRVVYGRLEQANNGTLFIDEVADLDMQAQVRLLSALTSRRFHRVAGVEPVESDVRVLAATRVDLEEQVREGRFREDLYYHLNVVPLAIPPLREHAQDVSELLSFYLDRFLRREALPQRSFSADAERYLRQYEWPGNIRELKNLVQRLLILGDGPEISLDEVRAALGGASARLQQMASQAESTELPFDRPLREAREAFERTYLQRQLREASGSVGELAKLAGMERTHLYRKLKALGIDPNDY